MKLKLSLRRAAGPSIDLLVTTEVSTTVGQLAEYLWQADQASAGAVVPRQGMPAGVATVTVFDGEPASIDPHRPVGESGLRSAMTVAVTRYNDAYPRSRRDGAATVVVTAGPDAGREFPLPYGSSVIGRERGCEVRLSDPLVSRQHARINVGDVVEIIDLGSANGVYLGDAPASRSPLRSGDTIRLGDTEMSLRLTLGTRAPARIADSASEGFVRSPRLNPVYEGRTMAAPEPPQRPAASRFPIVPLLAPLLMGALLFLLTHTMTSLVFVALSPLMILGHAVESMLAGRSQYKRALRQFRAEVAELTTAARSAAEQEVAARGQEHPSLGECVEAIRHRTPLLWSRRPGEAGFVELRLGLGRQLSRNSIELPDRRAVARDLYEELITLADEFATVDGVPVVARMAAHGALGLAGARPVLLACARALIVQAVALHSPAELVVAAFGSAQSGREWDWLKWLPHTTSAHSPLSARHLVASASNALALVSELEDLLARREAGDAQAEPGVLVLVEDDAPIERSRLVDVAERGWRHGIFVLWVATDTTLLPAACRTFVTLGHDTASGAAGFVHSGEMVTPLGVDLLDAATALELSRRLAPVVDIGARIDDDSDLPRSVSLLTLGGQPMRVSSGTVIERWAENQSIVTGPYASAKPPRQPLTLRAVVGASAAGPHALDLRADGPHALVGGTTGSGKSELLQSWILAMAAAHSPQRLAFLLVDYKGGSAFKDLEGLPHTVNLVTDLTPHLVRRALISLRAELTRREKLFKEHNVKDLVELERKNPPAAPPSLVIVVDEFAALITELPEFIDGMIDVAQRGRSLGVHLILATQRPAGVIKENLRANTNLRIALRTADEADSVDVLGTPQAAYFDSALPGRAVSKTGPGRLVPFQSGYAGGWTTEQPPPPEILVEELRFGGWARWELPEPDEEPVDHGPTDISRLVDAIEFAQIEAQIPKPRKPWLEELRRSYDLADREQVPNRRRDDELVFGIMDDPRRQDQRTAAFRPDIEGNLAVYGTGGSGKSTLLRTLAVAAGFTIHGGPCHVYGLDFGARGLAMLEDLAHVGSIIPSSDHERVSRLLSWLAGVVSERAVRFAAAEAGSITEYRAITDRLTEPRILLLLDGVSAFRQAYEVGEHSALFDKLCAVANDGRPVGVHVLLTADRPASVPSALASAVQSRVVLRMADANEYGLMGVPSDVLGPSSPPGRGLLNGYEVQVAILGGDSDFAAQVRSMRDFGNVMAENVVYCAPPIRRLPDRVPLSTLPAASSGRPLLGVASATLAPQTFEPRGGFLVSGPPGSGRTSALRALAVALRRWNSGVGLHYFGNRRSVLSGLDIWTTCACDPDEAAESAAKLASELQSAIHQQPTAVFIEDVAEFVNGPADSLLTALARVCVADGHFIVGEGETTTLSSGSVGLLAMIKRSRTGLALAPDTADGATFRTNFPPRLNRGDFPPGRALLVGGGKASVVQIGLAEEE